MKLNLGNLQAGTKATIKFVYLETLDVAMNKFWRLMISNTFSSRSVDPQIVSENM